MPPKPSPKQKAADKQAELEEARQGKAAAQKEQEDAAAWADGAKDNAKARAAEEKEAERRRKAAENAALLAGEEAELSKVVRTGKAAKKTGKDDFALLNDALSKQPKTKAQKDAEIKQKADEERKKKEAENREKKEAIKKVGEGGVFLSFHLLVQVQHKLSSVLVLHYCVASHHRLRRNTPARPPPRAWCSTTPTSSWCRSTTAWTRTSWRARVWTPPWMR
jgi:hypothetical protein